MEAIGSERGWIRKHLTPLRANIYSMPSSIIIFSVLSKHSSFIPLTSTFDFSTILFSSIAIRLVSRAIAREGPIVSKKSWSRPNEWIVVRKWRKFDWIVSFLIVEKISLKIAGKKHEKSNSPLRAESPLIFGRFHEKREKRFKGKFLSLTLFLYLLVKFDVIERELIKFLSFYWHSFNIHRSFSASTCRLNDLTRLQSSIDHQNDDGGLRGISAFLLKFDSTPKTE